jgi:sugar/nucleoside kinase (ribokinase family)
MESGRGGEVDAALAILAQHLPIVAAKQGERGATAQRGQQIVHSDTIPVSVVDTTGAGDSFDAGFVFGFLAGWDLPRTLRLACVCGAISTQAAGGTTAQPTLDEALAYMDT